MKSIDWQAFQDGSMHEDERGELRRLMASDPKLQEEWSAFQAFRVQVAAAMTGEAVPFDRLERTLHRVVQQHGPQIAVAPLSGMLLAGAALATVVMLHNPNIVDSASAASNPLVSVAHLTDPKAARSWATSRSGFDAPADLSGAAQLKCVSASPKRVEYQYEAEGQTYTVQICRAREVTFPASGIVREGATYFDRPNGVAFQKHGLAYDVSGPSHTKTWELAEIANRRCNAVPVTNSFNNAGEVCR